MYHNSFGSFGGAIKDQLELVDGVSTSGWWHVVWNNIDWEFCHVVAVFYWCGKNAAHTLYGCAVEVCENGLWCGQREHSQQSVISQAGDKSNICAGVQLGWHADSVARR